MITPTNNNSPTSFKDPNTSLSGSSKTKKNSVETKLFKEIVILNFKDIRTLDNFSTLVDQLQLAGVDRTNDKYFSYADGKTVSMRRLVRKLSQIYKSECFRGAQLTEKDRDRLTELKGKIEVLDNLSPDAKKSESDSSTSQKIAKTSKAKGLRLRIIKVARRIIETVRQIMEILRQIFLWVIVDKDAILQEIGARAEKSSEALLLHDRTKTDLSTEVEKALDYSYKNYYKTPFEDTAYRKREAKRTVKGEEIHRYNHGLAHATRKVFFTPFVVEYVLRHSLDNLSSQLQDLISEDGKDNFIKKLQIAVSFEVVGRKSECGSRDNLEVYKSYLENSKEAFEKFCGNQDLIGDGKLFKDSSDCERYGKAITDKYENRSLDKDMDVIIAIVDIVHTLDEFRCYWPSRMQGEIEGINHHYTKNKNNRDLWELAKFCQQSVRVTGDRLMTEFSEGFSQRDREFAHGNLYSMLIRNYTFTDGNTFIECSRDYSHCWKLLQKIAPPISYSRGETTYSHLLHKNQPSSLSTPPKQQNLQPLASFKKVQEIISNGRAAIRLVNTHKEKFGFEMTMLNDTVFFRPTRPVQGERDWVLEDRESGKLLERSFKKKRDSLAEQIAAHHAKKSMVSDKRWKPVNRDEDRGLPKLTEFAKKLSFVLLRPDAKVHHFTGEFPKEYFTYAPVGFLYDVDDLDQKQQKHIFSKDVGTSSKFWIGKNSVDKRKIKEGRDTNCSLYELQKLMKERADKNMKPQSMPFIKMQHAVNEMLMCPKKSKIKAIFSPKDTTKSRVQTFIQAIYLSQDYGVQVPVIVLDGKAPPRAYSRKDLKKDLKKLFSSKCLANKKVVEDLFLCSFSKMDRFSSKKEKLNALYQECCKAFDESIFPENLDAK